MAVNNNTPNIALGNLPTPPPPGSIQFFDGYFPALPAGDYSIGITQTLSGVPGAPSSFTIDNQGFTVQAPEFFIDTGIVQTFYPPASGSDQYDTKLPFIILTDPSLPWERNIVPNGPLVSSGNPIPWMALAIFAENEIVFAEGSSSGNPVSTTTVSNFLASDPNVLKPTFPTGFVSADQLASTCQTITIPGSVFNNVLPSCADLPYIAHCRAVNTVDEGEQLLSVLLCNRLAVADTSTTPATSVKYYAHLISLEGYAAYLGPNGTPIPNKAGGGLMDVQLVSLFNWTFTSLPETGESFEAVMQGLIASETTTQGALSLPVPQNVQLPTTVTERLNDGYVPLTFVAGSGDETFAWYRGPFSAVPPQPLPQVSNPPVPVVQAGNADALMIYLAEQGLFDLSYASAWNIGRNTALADVSFVQKLSAFRQTAHELLGMLTQRISMLHFAGETDIKSMLTKNAGRARFSNQMGTGLGKLWTQSLRSARQTPAPVPETVQRPGKTFNRAMLHPRAVLAQPGVADAISENLGDIKEAIILWLKNLSLLYPLPFSYLVPNPQMLPVESIRFFYVDPAWTQALIAGAMSIAAQSSKDIAIYSALLPTFTADSGAELSGMLIRSQLITNYPKLVITATLGGAPMNIIRNDTPAPSVRLVLFNGIPDTVTLSEPYQGLLFGIEPEGIMPRCATSYSLTGALISNSQPVPPTFRTLPASVLGGVLDIKSIAAALEPAIGILPFNANAVVNWNGTALTTTFVNANQLLATVPANLVSAAGTAAITVLSDGATSQPVNFTINTPLSIDSINPVMMLTGSGDFVLTVSGTGFAATAAIQWNGTPLTTTVISSSEATATVPSNLVATLGSAAITIVSNGATSNSVTFNIVGGDPVIDTIRPNVIMMGSPGFTLTIMGTGFTTKAAVEWNGVPLPTVFVTEKQITAAVTSNLIMNTGNIPITVSVNGTASTPATFTIVAQQPTIGSLQPAVAMTGGSNFTLTVDGVNFASGAQIMWNGAPLTTTFDSAEQLIATIPATMLTSAGSIPVTVNSGGVTSNTSNFTVIAAQSAIGLLEPCSVIAGAAGFNLIVTGGFGAGDFALQMVAAPELQSFTR